MSRDGDFVEVFVSCPLEVCEDIVTRRASTNGPVPGRSGISPGSTPPTRLPEAAELVVETQDRKISECVDQIIAFLRQHGYIEAAVSRVSSLS